MGQGIRLFVFPVDDPARAKALDGRLLGTEPYVDAAHYGAQLQQAIKDVGGGRLTAWVDGNIIGLMQ